MALIGFTDTFCHMTYLDSHHWREWNQKASNFPALIMVRYLQWSERLDCHWKGSIVWEWDLLCLRYQINKPVTYQFLSVMFVQL